MQDKINAFWEITKRDLEDRRAELRNKDREMEEMEERHQVSHYHKLNPQHPALQGAVRSPPSGTRTGVCCTAMRSGVA